MTPDSDTVVSSTVTYQYRYGNDNAQGWNYLLTSYDINGDGIVDESEKISYDEIGNPTTYMGASTSWNGRQLTAYSKGGVNATFTYDADGLRGSKTVNGVKTVYQYVGDKLYYEKRGDNQEFYYFYDGFGNLSTIYYTFGDSRAIYYVTTNMQGDVNAIYNSSGALVARYEYDAWGNTLSLTDASGNPITAWYNIANANPIRYRGYYYDKDLDLYYLQSRYYDSNTGRFLNADGFVTTGQGVLSYNMFAYCMNNPVMLCDPSGYISSAAIITIAVVASVIVLACAIVIDCLTGNHIFGASVSTTNTLDFETPILPDFLPITFAIGERTSDMNWSMGDSTKPISVYANAENENLIISSSAGVLFNISNFTLNFNLSLDNIGIYGSVKNDKTITGFGIKGNISKIKIGVESFETQILDGNCSETVYANASISAYMIAYAYYLASGLPVQAPTYSRAY